VCYKPLAAYLAVFGSLLLAVGIWAQSPTGTPASTKPETPQAKPTPLTKIGPEVKRWLEIDAFNLGTRYRYIALANGVAADQQQWQFVVRGRFKFDRKSRFTLNFGLFTGNVITGGWNNTGLGTGRGQTNLYFKQLYFSAEPIKELEIQVGGLGLNNGENTEITGYDNDAYVTGERLRIHAPRKLYFDEISVTYGYLGDPIRPSVFQRFHRMNESNYHQVLIRKQIDKHVGVSADYTFETGRDILRQAIKFKPPVKYFFTSLLFEQYERVSTPNGYGMNASAEKVINKRFTVSGGFARTDRRILFNADRFPTGKRIYLGGIYKLRPDLAIGSIIIEGVGPLPTPVTPRRRFEILFNWNVLESLHRHHIF